MELTIIIVNYNTKKLLRNAINSIKEDSDNIKYTIIVVDNASMDDSCEMLREEFPEVLLIENDENLGFSKANNLGINLTSTDFILLLNSDTLVQKDCIEKCLAYIRKDPQIGALGCRVVLSDGRLDHACKRGFPTPSASFFYMLKLEKLFPKVKAFGGYTLNYLSDNEINEVDSLTGAFMLLRKDIIEKVGSLDEDFFMYGEDIDWCYRIKEAGYKIIYYPKASIIHLKGGSNGKKRNKTIYEFYRAMFLFYNKHYKKKYNFLITSFTYLSIFLILFLSLIQNFIKLEKK